MLHTKFPLFLILLVCSIKVFGQSPNNSYLTAECNNYIFYPKKIKLRFKPELATFQLAEVKVDLKESIYVKSKRCEKKLEVISESGDISIRIARVIKYSYPRINAPKMKIVIKDIRILYNQLPTPNPRLYVTMDFYLENVKKEYVHKYSTTNFAIIPKKNIERPLGRLVQYMIEDFQEEKRYRTPLAKINTESVNETPKGIYTSFFDITSGKPTYVLNYKIKKKFSEGLRDKHILLDEKDKKVKIPFLAVNDGEKLLINVGYYYPRNYYVEISKLTDKYYFIYDQIEDYIKGGKSILFIGGGILGAVASSAATSRQYPGIINIKTGELITYSRNEMKTILNDKFERFKALLEAKNRLAFTNFFYELFSDEEMKTKLEEKFMK